MTNVITEQLLKCDSFTLYSEVFSCTILFQARNLSTNEAVAIKKMSYAGKQSNEV